MVGPGRRVTACRLPHVDQYPGQCECGSTRAEGAKKFFDPFFEKKYLVYQILEKKKLRGGTPPPPTLGQKRPKSGPPR